MGSGIYDECMEWSVSDLKNKKRMGGAGHPLEVPEFEKILLKFMKDLKEDKQQFITPLLVNEALFHRPSWKGGVESTGFMGRAQNDTQLFMARNNLSWRCPI